MSLLVDGSTEKINHGSGASLDNLDVGSCIVWFFKTTTDMAARIFQKGLFSPVGFHILTLNESAVGDISFARQFNGTDMNRTCDGGMFRLHEWTCVGARWNCSQLDANEIRFFLGTLSKPLTEVTYPDDGTDGTGSTEDNSGVDLYFANKVNDVTPLDGRMAKPRLWNRILSLDELRRQQVRRPGETTGPGCVLDCEYEGLGTQFDRSGNGNDGTVTAATAAPHLPAFRRRRIVAKPPGRIMSSLVGAGGLAGVGGIAGQGGGLAA